jgi:hypothetical protein
MTQEEEGNLSSSLVSMQHPEHWAWEHPCSLATPCNTVFEIHFLLKKPLKP